MSDMFYTVACSICILPALHTLFKNRKVSKLLECFKFMLYSKLHVNSQNTENILYIYVLGTNMSLVSVNSILFYYYTVL